VKLSLNDTSSAAANRKRLHFLRAGEHGQDLSPASKRKRKERRQRRELEVRSLMEKR
jgi:hypothetical protein